MLETKGMRAVRSVPCRLHSWARRCPPAGPHERACVRSQSLSGVMTLQMQMPMADDNDDVALSMAIGTAMQVIVSMMVLLMMTIIIMITMLLMRMVMMMVQALL